MPAHLNCRLREGETQRGGGIRRAFAGDDFSAESRPALPADPNQHLPVSFQLLRLVGVGDPECLRQVEQGKPFRFRFRDQFHQKSAESKITVKGPSL